MSATIAAQEQVQTAPVTAPATPTATSPEVITDFRDVADQLSTARMTGDTAEATRLEALIAGSPPAPPQAAAAPTQTPEAQPPQAEVVEPKEEQTLTEQPTPEPEAETGEEPSETETEPEAKAPRVRIHDPLDQAFQALRRAGVEPHDAHERIYGAKPQPASEAAQEQQPISTPQIAQMEAELATIEAQLETISDGEPLYTKEIKDLTNAHSRLTARIEASRITAAQEQQSNAAFVSQREAVLADVAKAFPAMADKTSVQYRLAAQLAREAQNPSHPDHAKLFQVNAPDYFAREAAKLTNITPVSPSVPQPKPVAAQTPQQPRPTISPAPGSKQTAPPPQPKSADEIARDTIAQTEAILTGTFSKPRSAHLGVLIR